MSLVIWFSSGSQTRPSSGLVAVCCAIALTSVLATSSLYAYDMPKNLNQGWDGDVQLGALATFGQIDSSAVSARTTFSYRSNRWEHELDAKLYKSASEVLVIRRDRNGEVMRDANNKDIKDLVKNTTNDRRFVSGQSRWFFTSKHYLFFIADIDVNTPANLRSSTRQIGGVGYKLYRSKTHLLSAGIGVGRKKREEMAGAIEQGAIGYFGLRLKRKVGEKLTLGFDLDSDFGSDNRYSEAETSLTWRLRDPVSLKLKYEARFNSTVVDPLNTFDDGLEAALSVNIAVEVF